MTFRRLWQTFLDRERHIAEGIHELYESYGEHHLLPYFGDIGLRLRTEPLRAADAPSGALQVEDGWLKTMEATPKRDNMKRLRLGTVPTSDDTSVPLLRPTTDVPSSRPTSPAA